MKYLDISDAQKDLLMLLDEIAVSREEVMITRDGIGVAIIQDIISCRWLIRKQLESGLFANVNL